MDNSLLGHSHKKINFSNKIVSVFNILTMHAITQIYIVQFKTSLIKND